jgi:hypothetical protein
MREQEFVITEGKWRKASYSQGENACVEVARVATTTAIRDSKLGAAGPVLLLPDQAWATFSADIKIGTFDL